MDIHVSSVERVTCQVVLAFSGRDLWEKHVPRVTRLWWPHVMAWLGLVV
jgi:hypothetical protein